MFPGSANARRSNERDVAGDGSRMNTNALPSPVSPVRSLAALQDEAQPESQPFLQSQPHAYPRGVSVGPEDLSAVVGEGKNVRAWSPLGGVADGGGSALGLGYVRARSKSC